MSSISGTNLAAAIAPFTTEDTYPTHYAEYGKGGWHSVATIADRDAVPAQRRETGMVVFVQADNTPYRLEADGTWKKLLTDIDSSLSETSENPVQNKVIAEEFNSFREEINKVDAAKADKVRVVNQTESAVTIQPNVMNVWGTITNLKVSKGDDIADIVNNYMIRFTAGDSAAVIFDGMNVKWYGGEVPTWTVGNAYEISIVDNIALGAEIEPAI